MDVYIWVYTGPVSDNWHSSGGLVVIADTLAQARERALAHLAHVKGISEAEWLTTDPDHVLSCLPVLSCNTEVPSVLVFPDAGCC